MRPSTKTMRPAVGNVIVVRRKVYECKSQEEGRLCRDCDFFKMNYNGTHKCVGPLHLECHNKIFKQIPEDSVELNSSPALKFETKPFVWLLVITLIVWLAIGITIINL